MTEREKMLRGLPYLATDPALSQERLRCKEVCARFNSLPPAQTEERRALLRSLLGHTGRDFWIEPDFWCDYGSQISLGEGFYANHGLVVLDCAPVTFGDDCLIGPQCGIYTAAHPLLPEQRKTGLEYTRPVTLGRGVWLGGHVTVLGGVSIGDNSVIGAGSVVTRSIPSGVVAAGVPCRVLREITEADRLPLP